MTSCLPSPSSSDLVDWPTYRGDEGRNCYSPLDQINTENVDQLEMTWTFHTGDAKSDNANSMQCNPLYTNGLLYIVSPRLKVFALDPATGKQEWVFDPQQGAGVSRGLSFWKDGNDARIFFTAKHFLYALDASTGTSIESFGEDGRVNLLAGLGRNEQEISLSVTSPGAIFEDLIILGSSLPDHYGSAPGHIRAYDVQTGEMEWIFHTIPQPGEFGYDTWSEDSYLYAGGSNCWAGISIDPDRGLAILGTGSPSFDFYGGTRIGMNLFGNCILALDARTGVRKWHYQVVHHDIWDYDIPSTPNLITVHHDGKDIDAVAQVTKFGFVFLLDRDTGKPLFPVEERPVPASDIPGEQTWPTQPFPVKPAPFVRQKIGEDDITDITPEDEALVKERIIGLRNGDLYHPPSLEGTLYAPGTLGGAEWSGAAYDPETGLLYVNANELPSILTIVKLDQVDGMKNMKEKFRQNMGAAKLTIPLISLGKRVYMQKNCPSCHGLDKQGLEPFPSLDSVKVKFRQREVVELITKGKGNMPAVAMADSVEIEALLAFLYEDSSRTGVINNEKVTEMNYGHTGWEKLRDSQGRPGIKPPWSTLTAIDMNTGDFAWQIPLGEWPGVPDSLQPTGTLTFGGGVVTKGGLLFIASTMDKKMRAFDKRTGRVLWEHLLPAGGFATPSVYEYQGTTYVVIAAGGRQGTEASDAVVAFSLPAEISD